LVLLLSCLLMLNKITNTKKRNTKLSVMTNSMGGEHQPPQHYNIGFYYCKMSLVRNVDNACTIEMEIRIL
jgi:hypothetical protein